MLNNAFAGMAELLKELRKRQNHNACNQCGQEINWAEKQYKRNCPKCGNVLIRSTALPQRKIECWICLDSGLVTYSAQVDDFVCNFGSACICPKGAEYQSTFIPKITEGLFAPPVEAIIRRNKQICKEQ